MQKRMRFTWMGGLAWFFLIVTTVLSLFPMYWLFVNALTPIYSSPPLTPILWPAFKLDNFQRLLEQGSPFYLRWMLNSLVIAVVVDI